MVQKHLNMRKTCNIRGCPEAADELAGNSRGLVGNSRWLLETADGWPETADVIGAAAADVDEAAGGAGRSLTAAADALGAAGGEGVLNTAADAAKNAKTKTKISKMLQKHINIRAGRNQLLTRLITRQERPEAADGWPEQLTS